MVTSIEPDVRPGDRLSIGRAATALGIDRKTLLRYSNEGKMNGGINCHFAPNGRRVFKGSEIIRFWKSYWAG